MLLIILFISMIGKKSRLLNGSNSGIALKFILFIEESYGRMLWWKGPDCFLAEAKERIEEERDVNV